jgi:sn-glycerol 3-phosphate transport system permease protein
MVERRPLLDLLAHLILLLGLATVVYPVWIAFVASTHEAGSLLSGTLPVVPGAHLLENYRAVLTGNYAGAGTTPIGLMLFNSLIMALGIAFGKIVVSLLAAFAVVYFRFPLRMVCFWLIFLTLMLPVEVRILPTYKVVADLHMLNSYSGLILPLIASATATLLFRQFFMTIPDELMEASRIDGAGPLKFLRDILLPLSRTNIAALFVILFIYGWNQYLWPLLITNDNEWYTVVMGLKSLVTESDEEPQWHLVMAATMLAMIPPVLVVITMQRLFVKGLVETEK